MHKFLFYNKFIVFLYMFRVLCAHHQEAKIVLYSIWHHLTCRNAVDTLLLLTTPSPTKHRRQNAPRPSRDYLSASITP